MSGRLIVVDGFSLAFRAFFAIPPESMTNSNGFATNSLYGFVSMLDGLLEEFQPSHFAVALDRFEPTFRDELNENYKGHRPPTHPAMLAQLEMMEAVLEQLSIPTVSHAGYEADDVIATLAELGADDGFEVVVVTGDRDSFQLVRDPSIWVLYNRRGVSDYQKMDEAAVLAKVGTSPDLYPFLAAMRGDPSDNLKGITGIGEKTAAKFANTYRNVETLYANIDALSPKIAQALRDEEENLRLNMALTPLRRDVPIGLSTDDLALGVFDVDKASQFFDFIESKRLAARTAAARSYIGTTATVTAVATTSITVEAAESIADVVGHLSVGGELGVAVAFSGEAGRSPIAAIALAARLSDQTFSCFVADISDEKVQVASLIQAIEDIELVGFEMKELLRRIATNGESLPKVSLDLGVASYLVDSNSGHYRQSDVVTTYLADTQFDASAFGEEGKDATPDLFSQGRVDRVALARSSVSALLLADILRRELESAKATWLYDAIENPLLVALAKMEAIGVAVDKQYLQQLAQELTNEVAALTVEIHELAGKKFNVNSTKQLAEVLFTDLGLTPPKKTKTGFSTDAQTLDKLSDSHPIIPAISRYREVEKLRSTYGESLIAEVAADGRIHATFNQMVARTGRLSSDHPNLHNIPIRTEDGKKFRYAFVAPKDRKLIVADYSQIELRVIAHLSRDPGLLEAFSSGQDIHTATASRVFSVPASQVNSSQRSKAKMVAYGLAYGMEAYGLAQRLNVDVKEAEGILKSFFAAFPTLRQYMDDVVELAAKRGYSETEFGRRRPMPDLSSAIFRVRQAAERQAMNSVIQGLAADIFKIALVNLDEQLTNTAARTVLQIHDEVVVEVDADQADEIASLVVETMEGAASLSVPLVANCYIVNSWGEAK
ncbi:MAG: DNA polymerase I [Actinomycetota bacterium]|nr:DNA polymerase I [Actinomycetota bacterium]